MMAGLFCGGELMNVYPVILAGGSGTRLWPLSREVLPKQFLSLVGGRTLFQRTLERAITIAPDKAPLVVCNAEHYFHCEDQVNELGIKHVRYILEPFGRDTAGAIALAALFLAQEGHGDVPMLVMPSDHLLKDLEHFKNRIQDAIKTMTPQSLVTFGITASKPETGYGYIERGDIVKHGTYQVKRFVEKPILSIAKEYLAAGTYYWNSGMFLFTPNAYMSELREANPIVAEIASLALAQSKSLQNYCRIDKATYELCPKISIDYAVLEKSPHILMSPLNTTWSDLGCWASVAESHEADDNNNVIVGNVFVQKSTNCYLNAQDNKLIAAVGLQDKIVVTTTDAVLVADKQYAQEVKALVQQLKDNNQESAVSHKRVQRPWGYYESLASGRHYQVKHIMVKPKSRLSLQSHQHRAEHWVVVSGEAEIVNGDQTLTLKANQSTYIPQGSQHRLSNMTDTLLHVIEVQSGDYLGEDDIVRYHDDYARAVQ
jgi:mannose-1-phosphate guanylyltransferase/mannose-6-phosphate isomerase